MKEEKQPKKKKAKLKKSVKIALGTITVIGGVSLFAYGNKLYKENNSFKRVVNDEGNYDLTGYITYENLKEYSVVEIVTALDERRIYIAKGSKQNKNNKSSYNYKDIYSDIVIGIDSSMLIDDTVISVSDINDFLIAYDVIKGKYSSDDIEYLLNKIKEDYENYQYLKTNKKIY